jgi:putative flippase GtrA
MVIGSNPILPILLTSIDIYSKQRDNKQIIRMDRIQTLTSNPKIQQFIRFFISGGLAFIVDFGILMILLYIVKYNDSYTVQIFGVTLHLVYANLISTFLGTVASFILNKYYAFQSRTNTRETSRQFSQFFVVGIFNYFVHNILFGYATLLGIPAPISKFFLIALQMIWSFFLYKIVVFKK